MCTSVTRRQYLARRPDASRRDAVREVAVSNPEPRIRESRTFMVSGATRRLIWYISALSFVIIFGDTSFGDPFYSSVLQRDSGTGNARFVKWSYRAPAAVFVVRTNVYGRVFRRAESSYATGLRNRLGNGPTRADETRQCWVYTHICVMNTCLEHRGSLEGERSGYDSRRAASDNRPRKIDAYTVITRKR